MGCKRDAVGLEVSVAIRSRGAFEMRSDREAEWTLGSGNGTLYLW